MVKKRLLLIWHRQKEMVLPTCSLRLCEPVSPKRLAYSCLVLGTIDFEKRMRDFQTWTTRGGKVVSGSSGFGPNRTNHPGLGSWITSLPKSFHPGFCSRLLRPRRRILASISASCNPSESSESKNWSCSLKRRPALMTRPVREASFFLPCTSYNHLRCRAISSSTARSV